MSAIFAGAGQVLLPGAKARDALNQLQEQLPRVRGALSALENSLRPHDETHALLVAELKAGIKQHVTDHVFGTWQSRQRGSTLPAQISIWELAWIEGPEALADKIMRNLKANGRAVGLPVAKYAEEQAKLQATLEKLERDEELEILRLEEAGHLVIRREDARPELLLQIWAEQHAERAAA